MSAPADTPVRRGWKHAFTSSLSLLIGLPIALPFYSPTAVGYVQMPGVIIGLVIACICVVSFVLCPMRCVLPKFITLVACAVALYFAVDFVGYYWLHLRFKA